MTSSIPPAFFQSMLTTPKGNHYPDIKAQLDFTCPCTLYMWYLFFCIQLLSLNFVSEIHPSCAFFQIIRFLCCVLFHCEYITIYIFIVDRHLIISSFSSYEQYYRKHINAFILGVYLIYELLGHIVSFIYTLYCQFLIMDVPLCIPATSV